MKNTLMTTNTKVSVSKVIFLQAAEFSGCKAKELRKQPKKYFLHIGLFRIEGQKQHNSVFQSHFT